MTDKPEVFQVNVPLKPPTANRQAEFCFGFYTLVDDVLIMTDPKGKPATDESGKTYTAKLDGEAPAQSQPD
jgi:hypothetical protein